MKKIKKLFLVFLVVVIALTLTPSTVMGVSADTGITLSAASSCQCTCNNGTSSGLETIFCPRLHTLLLYYVVRCAGCWRVISKFPQYR